jgi:hypothetical protein
MVGLIGFTLLCPLFGFMTFMRMNARNDSDRSVMHMRIGLSLQILFALLPWMTLLRVSLAA